MAAAEIERRMSDEKTVVEYRDDGKTPVISGYAAVFNSESRNLGGFVETIRPDAFNAVLAKNPDVVGVYNHDKNFLLGRTGNGTMTLSVDAYGLRYHIVPPATRADVVESVTRGDVVGSSFAFAVSDGGDVWSRGVDGVRRREIRQIGLLDDVGPVVRPAYGASSVVVSRRAIEMALGESHRPSQTMANAAKRGLKLAAKHESVDQRLLMIAETLAARSIVSVEEVEYLSGIFQRCEAARGSGWNGTPAWIEWQLAGGDGGRNWIARRATENQAPVQIPDAQPAEETRAAAEISLKPTAGMASACRRGLKLYEDGRGGDGLVAETISWARKIAGGESLTKEKVVKMAAWHARHKVDKRPGWDKSGEESPGFVAYLLWAGAAGQRWSQAKVNQLRKAGEVRDMEDVGDDYEANLDDRQMEMAEAYEGIEEEMGQWSQDEAHYVAENPFATRGIKCQNCVFYEEGACELVSGQIAANAVCKLWIIPEDRMADEKKDEKPAEETPATAQRDTTAEDAIAKAAALKAILLSTRLQSNQPTA
jgi:HK97 family phage prohead protease